MELTRKSPWVTLPRAALSRQNDANHLPLEIYEKDPSICARSRSATARRAAADVDGGAETLIHGAPRVSRRPTNTLEVECDSFKVSRDTAVGVRQSASLPDGAARGSQRRALLRPGPATLDRLLPTPARRYGRTLLRR
jgi:hypothetical protein